MRFDSHDDFATRLGIGAVATRLAPVERHSHPLVSPVHTDLTDLPPPRIQVGAAETLRDDGVRVAESGRSSGVQVELGVWPDMIQAWDVSAPILEERGAAIGGITVFVGPRTGPSPDARLDENAS